MGMDRVILEEAMRQFAADCGMKAGSAAGRGCRNRDT